MVAPIFVLDTALVIKTMRRTIGNAIVSLALVEPIVTKKVKIRITVPIDVLNAVIATMALVHAHTLLVALIAP